MACAQVNIKPNSMLCLQTKYLIVFGFDHTLVDVDTSQGKLNKSTECIYALPPVPHMFMCLKLLKSLACDLILISDSNSVIIQNWLQAHNLSNCFKAIYTNPACITSMGEIAVQPYQYQSECALSSPTLCKGAIITQYLHERENRDKVQYKRIILVGQSNGDICPALRLRECDLVCARVNFPMLQKLRMKDTKFKLHAELLIWKEGEDLAVSLRDWFRHVQDEDYKELEAQRQANTTDDYADWESDEEEEEFEAMCH